MFNNYIKNKKPILSYFCRLVVVYDTVPVMIHCCHKELPLLA